jgi:hypothetical protein
LNPIGSIVRPDLTPIGSSITSMSLEGNSLYIGYGAYGLTGWDISRPSAPVFVAAFSTYSDVSSVPYSVGVLSICTVPGLQDIVYISNVDDAGRSTFQGFKFTRGSEAFLQTSSENQLVTVHTLVSGGVTQVDVESSSFILGSTDFLPGQSSDSTQVILPHSSSSKVVVVKDSSSSSEMTENESSSTHFRFENQTVPSGFVIIKVPVPVPVYIFNSAVTLGSSLVVLMCAVAFALI